MDGRVLQEGMVLKNLRRELLSAAEATQLNVLIMKNGLHGLCSPNYTVNLTI